MANIIVCSKFPNDLVLSVTVKGEVKNFTILGAKHANNGIVKEKNQLKGLSMMTSVDEDLFKLWLAENTKHPAIVNGVIFTAKDAKGAKKEAKDREKEKTGLEGLEQSGDKRAGNNKTGEIEKATEE